MMTSLPVSLQSGDNYIIISFNNKTVADIEGQGRFKKNNQAYLLFELFCFKTEKDLEIFSMECFQL